MLSGLPPPPALLRPHGSVHTKHCQLSSMSYAPVSVAIDQALSQHVLSWLVCGDPDHSFTFLTILLVNTGPAQTGAQQPCP